VTEPEPTIAPAEAAPPARAMVLRDEEPTGLSGEPLAAPPARTMLLVD